MNSGSAGSARDDSIPTAESTRALAPRDPRPGPPTVASSSAAADGGRVLDVTGDDRLCVLSPHPDDECLAAGGLLARAAARGARVRVLFASDGDDAVWIQRAHERRWRVGPADRLRFGTLRRAEARAAMGRLGIDPADLRFLGFPDQGLTPALLRGGEQVVERLARELGAFEPTLLVVPSASDLHPDHSALAVLVRLALDRAPRGSAEARVVAYRIHRRGPPATRAEERSLWLDEREQRAKRDAIGRYASQLSVHRRKFLAFASPGEEFLDLERDGLAAPDHPVRALERGSDGRVKAEVVTRSRAGCFGRSELLLSLACGAGLRTWSIDLARESESAPVREMGGCGAPGTARVERRERGLSVAIPAGVLPAEGRLFAKVERRFGFYDEAGWVEPCAVRRRPAAVRPARRADRPRSVCVVVPCFDVVGLCGPVLRDTLRQADRVLAVDDGSTDGTGELMERIAAGSGGRMTLIRFARNRGKGAALLCASARRSPTPRRAWW